MKTIIEPFKIKSVEPISMNSKSDRIKRELYEAMELISTTDKGPKEQNNSIGCSIKWKQ